MQVRLLAASGVIAGVLAASAAAQPQTTAPNIFVKIHVTLTDSKVILSPKHAPRGTDAQFLVRNIGTKPHTFTFGTLKRGLGVQTGFSRVVKPGQHKVLLLYLNYRGALPYYSDHGRAKGKFIVGEDVTGSVN
jgi:hypothetical protein